MKTVQEWLDAFNLYYNNIDSNLSPGLLDSEIATFLTDAQNSVIIGLYKGTLGSPFEQTEETTEYLVKSVKGKSCELALDTSDNFLKGVKKVYIKAATADYNEADVLFKVSEKCLTKDGNHIEVVPVTHDEVLRTIKNPFKRGTRNRALRLSTSEGFQLISDAPLSNYYVRYLETPPAFDEVAEDWACPLPEALHSLVISEAVRLAKAIWKQ